MEDAAKEESIESQAYMLDYYKMAADYGNSAEAQYKMAEYYDQRYLKHREEKEAEDANAKDTLENAITYYEKAANQGYQAAVWKLFERLSECGRPKEAAEWIHKPAESGDPEAQFELGQCYEQGNGVDKAYRMRWNGTRKQQVREMSMRRKPWGNVIIMEKESKRM